MEAIDDAARRARRTYEAAADTFDAPANGFWALTGDGELLGFRSFGTDGRVPGYDYDESALDTGGGLRPDLTGRGLGAQAISAGLEFGQREFAPAAFRMTVAAVNVRAQRVILRLGFTLTASFLAPTGVRYQILVRPSQPSGPPAGR